MNNLENLTKKELTDLENTFNSQKECLEYFSLNITDKNINLLKNIFKKNNLALPNFRKNFFNKTNFNLAKEIIYNSNNYTEALSGFGKSDRGTNITELKKFILENNIDISHFGKKIFKHKQISHPTELFKKNSPVERGTIKQLILRLNLLEYKCSICNLNPIWKNKKLTLIIDHINGINNDNRLSNLRFVCPNCDSQLETFTGRNKLVTEYPTKESVSIFKAKQFQKYNFNCIIERFHTNYIPLILTKSILHNIYTKRRIPKLIKDFKNEHGDKFLCKYCKKEINKTGKTQECKICIKKHMILFIKKNEQKNKPNLETLKKDLEELGSYLAVAKKYEVSDNAIRKWIKKYGSEKISSELINFEKKAKEISNDLNKLEILSYDYKNYNWIQHVRNDYYRGNLSKEKFNLIEKYKLPIFETKNPKEILEERKIEYINFIKKHKRKPLFSDKVSIEEKFLARWISNTKRRYIDFYKELKKEIEELLK